MYIVKDLNDFEVSSKQRLFVDFIKDKIGSSCSYEQIKNVEFQKKYAMPLNDFVVYDSRSANARIQRISTAKAYK